MVNITLQALDQSGNTREASAMWRIRNDPKVYRHAGIIIKQFSSEIIYTFVIQSVVA